MEICKNAEEYWHELWKLRGEGFKKYYSDVSKLRSVFHAIEDPTRQDYENIDRDENRLLRNCLSEVKDFENMQPIKPLYIFKKGRKFFELRFVENNPGLWFSPEPLTKQTIREKSNAWILPICFNGDTVDIVRCEHCGRVLVKYWPNQKYCFMCQRSPRSKRPHTLQSNTRYCQNPGCEKPIPAGKNKRAKYCSNACKTAAYEKRKL
jgi:hypothetical protein